MSEEQKLREAHQTLRDGYADAVAGLRYIRQRYGSLDGVGFDRVDDHFFKWVEIAEREGLLAGSHTLPLATPTSETDQLGGVGV